MEHRILKSISVLFHPLIMPLLGVMFYFYKTPRYVDQNLINAKLISLFILTVLLPILLFFLLKTLGKVSSIYLKTTNERIVPLALNGVITVLILLRVLPQNEFIELYYFFIGILMSTIISLVLAFAKFKASLHLVSISGIFMFFVALSIHFSINIVKVIAIICLLTGAIATSRLHLKAHTYKELIMGFFVGFIPQLILIPNWL
ncbi:hypothetical protein GCM10022291_11170 [Postechiella marina]|uniref:Transmembrane protein n=1 Tax=Postechiella marina TaxID=943941 RepID=A0ABP8C4L4_9FLAO